MKIIFRPICWIKTLWLTLTNPEIIAMLGKDQFVWFSGHEWREYAGQSYPVGQGDLECDMCGAKDILKRK